MGSLQKNFLEIEFFKQKNVEFSGNRKKNQFILKIANIFCKKITFFPKNFFKKNYFQKNQKLFENQIFSNKKKQIFRKPKKYFFQNKNFPIFQIRKTTIFYKKN